MRNIKIQNSKFKIQNLGFTMIELLIVIAVLGILAVAVLAAINPIEQIDRSKDTGSRSDSEQLIGGIDRYYTQKGYYPWQNSTADSANMDWTNTKTLNGANLMLNKLSEGTSELKSSFISRVVTADYNTLYIYNGGTAGNSTYVCFKPQSKAFEDDGIKRCGEGLPSDLTAINANICGGVDNTYSCLP